MKNIYISFLIVCHIIPDLLASSPIFLSDCQKADVAFEAQQFQRAITLYLSCKDIRSDVLKLEKLAYAYSVIGQLDAAEQTYREAALIKGFSGRGELDFIQLLHRNGKEEEALMRLDQYLLKKPRDKDALKVREQLSMQASEEDAAAYTLQLADFNSEVADFSPFLTKEGLVFSSERKTSGKKSPVTGQNFTKLFIRAHETGEVKEFSGPFDSRFNDGSASFSKDGQWMYFTRNRVRKLKNQTARLQIMESQKVKGEWTPATEFVHNQAEFDYAHPAINPSATMLIFSSNRSGSSGGMDLFYCLKNKRGSWESPKNMGKEVNTAGNELFPVFIDDTTLAFASDGRIGFGGLDLYKVHYTGRKWTATEHLPAPFNSVADDYGLYSNDGLETGWFTSNRQGVEHIFQFDKVEKQPRMMRFWVQVKDKYNGKPLPGTRLQLAQSNQPIKTVEYDGLPFSVTLEHAQSLLIKGEWEGLALTEQHYQADYAVHQEDTLTLWLDFPGFIIRGKTVALSNKQPLEGVEVKLCPKGSVDCLKSDSDGDGIFTFHTKDVSTWQISGQKKDMFCNPIELDLNDYNRDSSVFIVLEMNFEVVELDKSFTLNNIYYDFDSWEIREDAERELDILIDFMNSNPAVVIELSSHTDSRGDHQYNMRLSQRRADAAVAYMQSKGIAANRILAKGYGESRLRNHCRDGVFCEEEEHQVNRRTEVRILDK